MLIENLNLILYLVVHAKSQLSRGSTNKWAKEKKNLATHIIAIGLHALTKSTYNITGFLIYWIIATKGMNSTSLFLETLKILKIQKKSLKKKRTTFNFSNK